MASFRFKEVAKAASGGLDLFIASAAVEEKRQAEQQWELTLENLRAKRQGEAEERAIGREESREAATVERERIRAETATARYEADKSAKENADRLTAQYRADTLEQADVLHKRGQMDKADAELQRNLASLSESMADALNDDTFGENEAAIKKAYAEARDQVVLTHVTAFAQKGAEGYEFTDTQGLKALMIGKGMQPAAAEHYAGQIAPQLFPDSDYPPIAETGGSKGEFYLPDPNNPGGVVRNPAYASPAAAPSTTAAAGSMPVNAVAPAKSGTMQQGLSQMHQQSFVPELIDKVKSGVEPGKPGETVPYGNRLF